MMKQDIFDINNAVTQLLTAEPCNNFYKSLQKQYHERKTLTQRQIECLQKDYHEKINNNKRKIETPEKHTPTPSPTPDKNVASATTNNNPAGGDVLVDPRKRTPAQLETVFGKLNKFKLMYLYNDSKISMAEYETAVKQLVEEII